MPKQLVPGTFGRFIYVDYLEDAYGRRLCYLCKSPKFMVDGVCERCANKETPELKRETKEFSAFSL